MNQHVAFLFQAKGVATGSGVALFVKKGQQSGAVLYHQDITPKVELSILKQQRISNVQLDYKNLILGLVE